MISFLKPAPPVEQLPPDRVDPEYRRLRWQLFAGISLGYAAYYLVRKNFALAIPDILKDYPQYGEAQLGIAMTGLSIAYGVSKFLLGSVSDKSNLRWFMSLGLLCSCRIFGAPHRRHSMFRTGSKRESGGCDCVRTGWNHWDAARHEQAGDRLCEVGI